MNPQADADPKGKGKAPPKGAVNPTEGFEEGDLEISDVPENNFLLGDAIEQVIKINYEERQKTKMPKTPNYLPLKLCLVGYPFAGKKTQAQKIKEKFGLDVFEMGALVEEAVTFAEKNPQPISVTPKELKTETNSAMLGGGGLGAALSGSLKNPTSTIDKDSELS